MYSFKESITLSFILEYLAYALSSHITYTAPTTTQSQIIESIETVWGKDSPQGIAIATCESQLRQYDVPGHVLHGVVNPADVGIFQINIDAHKDELFATTTNIYTIKGNIVFAKYLFDTQGTKPWEPSRKCWSKLVTET